MSSIKGSVRFIGSSPEQVRWGGNDDPVAAGVKSGVLYDVVDIEVHTMHTKLRLHGIEGQFNSVSFEWLDGTPLREAIAKWQYNNL